MNGAEQQIISKTGDVCAKTEVFCLLSQSINVMIRFVYISVFLLARQNAIVEQLISYSSNLTMSSRGLRKSTACRLMACRAALVAKLVPPMPRTVPGWVTPCCGEDWVSTGLGETSVLASGPGDGGGAPPLRRCICEARNAQLNITLSTLVFLNVQICRDPSVDKP